MILDFIPNTTNKKPAVDIKPNKKKVSIEGIGYILFMIERI